MFFIGWEMQFDENGHNSGQLVIGSFIITTHRSCTTSCAELFGKPSNHPGAYRPDLAPWDFWIFPELESPLKGKKFRPLMRFRKIQRGSWWQFQQRILQSLLNSGRDAVRTVWGPKMPTLKGTEVSLSHVQCLLYLASSINVSIFHSAWLDTFWTELVSLLSTCYLLGIWWHWKYHRGIQTYPCLQGVYILVRKADNEQVNQ